MYFITNLVVCFIFVTAAYTLPQESFSLEQRNNKASSITSVGRTNENQMEDMRRMGRVQTNRDVVFPGNGSRSFDVNSKSSLNYLQSYIVDLLPRSNNAIQPGETITLVFNVTSLQTIPAEITFTCQTTRQQYFQQINVRPLGSTIQPGTSIEAIVTATVHRNVPQGTTILIEFLVRSYWEPQPAASRAAYIYVGTQQSEDWNYPSFNYYVRSNCKDLPTDSCSLAVWSLEGTVQDSNSGLVSVVSNPTGIIFQGNFIAGTKSIVPISYSASCCAPTIDIITTDTKGNSHTYHIDAYADDQLLSDAEIGLIVLGVILILILIVLIVLAICLCRKSRSHDLRN